MMEVDEIVDKHELGTLDPSDYPEAIDVLVEECGNVDAVWEDFLRLEENFFRLKDIAEWSTRLTPRLLTAMTKAIGDIAELVPEERAAEA